MTWYDVYVARAGDPAFSNESGNPSAHNCSDPISPVLYDRACFVRVVEIGEQLDWGVLGARGGQSQGGGDIRACPRRTPNGGVPADAERQ